MLRPRVRLRSEGARWPTIVGSLMGVGLVGAALVWGQGALYLSEGVVGAIALFVTRDMKGTPGVVAVRVVIGLLAPLLILAGLATLLGGG